LKELLLLVLLQKRHSLLLVEQLHLQRDHLEKRLHHCQVVVERRLLLLLRATPAQVLVEAADVVVVVDVDVDVDEAAAVDEAAVAPAAVAPAASNALD